MGGGSSKRTQVRAPARRRSAVNAGSIDPEAAANFEKKVVPKSDETVEAIRKALEGNDLFTHLDKNELQDLLDCMFEVTAKKDEEIITQGADGDNFYVMNEGTAEVYVDNNKVHEYVNGGSFGELALIYGTPRAATVKATCDMTLYAMDRDTYRHILMGSVLKKRQLYDDVLKKVNVLSELDDYERSSLADALQQVTFKEGDVIIKQGDEGDDFFFVIDGQCVVTQTNESGETGEVATLGTGDFFGEIALLTNEPRKATVTAKGEATICAKLDRGRFERVLGPCEEILRRNMENYKQFTGKSE
eukprot:m.227417 g.227417  ORF g.227417 m.227417 type:complete len:303 (-) comp19241_c0_seq2:143-1051(-)